MILILCLLIPVSANLDLSTGILTVENNIRSKQELEPVLTEQGPVRGVALGETDIVQYFDIPYGRFDIDNPFQDPVKPQAWSEVLSKDKHSSQCPQIGLNDEYKGNADCLTLSVFAKTGIQNAEVLFHIHDGDFKSGSGDPTVYNPQPLASEGIIVVLPNYRLGVLGFMCWQNETVPGNAGIKDLALALQWVKNNIESFGGNATNIVVSGADSAGILVDFLVLLNETSKYISKGITESGFALSHKALERDPTKTVDGKVNINSDLQSMITSGKGMNFKPCIDNNLIRHSFWNLLKIQTVGIPLMIGSTNQAGMEYVTGLSDSAIKEIDDDLSLLLPTDLIFKGNQENEAMQRIKTQYFRDGSITKNSLESLSLCFTDSTYLNAGIREARLLTKAGGTVYFYEFSFTGDRQNPLPGAAKGDSLHYVFRQSTTQPTNGAKARERTEQKNEATTNPIRTLWINFIKTGVPSTSNIAWKAFGETDGKENCLMIGAEITLTDKLHAERMKLWDDIYEHHFIETSIGSTLKSSLFVILISFCICNFT